MNAETVYNVASCLPPSELERLLNMLSKKVEPKESKKVKKKIDEEEIRTKAEDYEYIYKLLNDRKKRKSPINHSNQKPKKIGEQKPAYLPL